MKIAPPSPLKNEVFSLIHGIKIFKKFNESPQGNNRDFTVSQKFKHVWTTRLFSSKDFSQVKKDTCTKKCPFQKVKKVSHEILHKQTKLPKDFLQQEKQFVDLFPESLAIMMNQASQLELTLRPRI